MERRRKYRTDGRNPINGVTNGYGAYGDPEDDPVGPLLDPEDDPVGPLLDPEDDPVGPLLDPEDDPVGPLLDPSDASEQVYELRARRRAHVRRPRYGGLPPGPPPPLARPEYSDSIIVRLSSLVNPDPAVDSLADLAELRGLDQLCTVLGRFGVAKPASSEPAVPWQRRSASSTQSECRTRISLDELERRAARSAYRPRHSLKSYWRLRLDDLRISGFARARLERARGELVGPGDLADEVVRHLNELPEVDLAYREIAASDPQDPLADFQHYQEDAPVGITAERTWTPASSDTGVNLVDLEQGWLEKHEDLKSLGLGAVIFGQNRDGEAGYVGNHGAATLALVEAEENAVGVHGIAARFRGRGQVHLASHFVKTAGEATDEDSRVAAAIDEALQQGTLKEGDVLLLEVQRGPYPVEFDPLDLDAIRLAVGNDVIVVEAAGNGGLDLDQIETPDGRSLNRYDRRFRDSGAIVVGSCRSALPHNRLPSSNFGSRIDCFAWGDGITSAGYGDYYGESEGNEPDSYTTRYSGTSGASAIITGAALAVQRIYAGNSGTRLSPREMRATLASRLTGTRQGRGRPGRIGVMPNLELILDRVLGVVPHPYIRGSADRGATTCASPDIFMAGLPDPSPVYRPLPPSVREGDDLCVDVRNRGIGDASVSATVYSGGVRTLLTPDRWSYLGKTKTATVVQGDIAVRVATGEDTAEAAGTGSPADIAPTVAAGEDTLEAVPIESPGGDPYSLIAVLESTGSEFRQKLAAGTPWSVFLRAMRDPGRLAIRNVHPLLDENRFKLDGTPDRARAFTFEILQGNLPAGARVHLTLPIGLGYRIRQGRLWKQPETTPTEGSVTWILPAQPRLPIGPVRLPANYSVDASLDVVATGLAEGHSLAIRQLYRGQEVGRITWRRDLYFQ